VRSNLTVKGQCHCNCFQLKAERLDHLVLWLAPVTNLAASSWIASNLSELVELQDDRPIFNYWSYNLKAHITGFKSFPGPAVLKFLQNAKNLITFG